MDLLKAISADEENCRMKQRGLLKGWASWGRTFSWQCGILFPKLQREGIDTAANLLELLQVYAQGVSKRCKTFEDEAKEKSGKQIYFKTKDNRWRKQRKRFHNESGDEPTGLDELPLGESRRINHFLPIIDRHRFLLRNWHFCRKQSQAILNLALNLF